MNTHQLTSQASPLLSQAQVMEPASLTPNSTNNSATPSPITAQSTSKQTDARQAAAEMFLSQHEQCLNNLKDSFKAASSINWNDVNFSDSDFAQFQGNLNVTGSMISDVSSVCGTYLCCT